MKYIPIFFLIFTIFIFYIDGAARFDAWEEVNITSDKIQTYAKMAFEKYNRDKKINLDFRRIIDAQKRNFIGVRYRINYLTRVRGCPVGSGCTLRFRAIVTEDKNEKLLSMEIILKASGYTGTIPPIK
uniref:Cystatin domain-containing protein n=1 Tax=Strongyloides venezuelensis TaxID=75913 RepID=A0A0K0FAT8_STRVS